MSKFERNRNREKEVKKTNDNIITVPIAISGEFYMDSNNLYNDVLDVIEVIPFKKISIPLYIKKNVLDPNDKDDRYTVVGYIKSYNVKQQSFRAFLFPNNKDSVLDILNNKYFVVAPLFTQRDDTLGTITKLALEEAVEYDNYDEYADEEYNEDNTEYQEQTEEDKVGSEE